MSDADPIEDSLTIILGRLEEGVYTRKEAKTALRQLIREARIDELEYALKHLYETKAGANYAEARLRELEGGGSE